MDFTKLLQKKRRVSSEQCKNHRNLLSHLFNKKFCESTILIHTVSGSGFTAKNENKWVKFREIILYVRQNARVKKLST